MIKAHRIRLNPSPEQEDHFRRACGTARFAYNWALNAWKERLDSGEPTSWQGLRQTFNKEVKPEKPWITEVNKCVPAMAIAQVGEAMSNFFNSKKGKRKGRAVGFPKFKCKNRSKDSFGIESDKVKVDSEKKRLWVPRLGWVEMTEALRFKGRIGNVRISRKADKWFASIPVEQEPDGSEHTHRNSAVGIDVGLTKTLTLSDGKTYQSPRALKVHEKKLKKVSRMRARKVRGSSNRKKAVLKESRQHARVENLRNDWLHKTSRKIADCHRLIILEDLNLSGMLKNHKLARALSDAALGEFRRQVSYKSVDRGGKTLEIDRWFPSTKLCRKCGHKISELRLSERVYHCESQACGHAEDRDLNAARNILKEGLRLHDSEVSVEIGAAGTELTPVERRASTHPPGSASSLVEAGST